VKIIDLTETEKSLYFQCLEEWSDEMKEAGKVAITALMHGWCPVYNMVYERTKRAADEFGDKVVLKTIPVRDKATIEEWGQSDAIFINTKQLHNGPPLSYDKIRKRIARQIKKLKG
jgi:pyruvate/2-oxoacid:ferredoxin oxidoreductase beta subunit